MPAKLVGVVASAGTRRAGGNAHVRSRGTSRGAIAGLTTRFRRDRAAEGPGIFSPVRCNAAGCRRARGAPPESFARDRGFVPEDAGTFWRRPVPPDRRVEFEIDFRLPLTG